MKDWLEGLDEPKLLMTQHRIGQDRRPTRPHQSPEISLLRISVKRTKQPEYNVWELRPGEDREGLQEVEMPWVRTVEKGDVVDHVLEDEIQGCKCRSAVEPGVE